MLSGEFQVRHLCVRFATPISNARQTWSTRNSWIVQFRNENGSVGYGEATPLPGRSLETEAQVATELSQLPRVSSRIDSNLEELAAVIPNSFCSAARFAAESALLDCRAKVLQKPLCDTLSASANDQLPLSFLIQEADLRHWRASVISAAAQEYAAFKFKVGRDWEQELDSLQALRERVRGSIRLDANQSLNITQWQRAHAQLKQLQIEYVEEPVAAADQGQLRSDSDLIAWDESLMGLSNEQLKTYLQRHPCKAIVLKPMLLGGISRSLAIAALARELGIQVVFSHAFDGPVAAAICAQLALAWATPIAQGLAPYAGIEAWPFTSFPCFSKHGHITKTKDFGIGEARESIR